MIFYFHFTLRIDFYFISIHVFLCMLTMLWFFSVFGFCFIPLFLFFFIVVFYCSKCSVDFYFKQCCYVLLLRIQMSYVDEKMKWNGNSFLMFHSTVSQLHNLSFPQFIQFEIIIKTAKVALTFHPHHENSNRVFLATLSPFPISNSPPTTKTVHMLVGNSLAQATSALSATWLAIFWQLLPQKQIELKNKNREQKNII